MNKLFKFMSFSLLTSIGLVFLSILFYPTKSLPSHSIVFPKKILPYTLNQEDLTDFINYLNLPTIRGNENLASLFFQNLFKKWGYGHGEIIPLPEKNRSVFMIEFGEVENKKENGLILLNHTDVVEFEESLWEVKQGEIKNNFIYGRGALDMKGLGFAQAIAIREFLKVNPHPQKKIMFLASPDEETGGLGAKFITTKLRNKLKGYKNLINEGGLGTLPSKTLNKKALHIQVAEKGILWLDVWTEFPPSHGSTPKKETSTHNLVLFLDELLEEHKKVFLSDESEIFFSELSNGLPFPGNFLVKRIRHPLLTSLVSNKLSHSPPLLALLRNTLSITWLNSSLSLSYNRFPAKAKARLDIRTLPGASNKDILNRIQEIADKYKVKVKVAANKKANLSPIKTSFFQSIQSTAKQLYPEAIITPLVSTGFTDSARFRAIGLNCYGVIPAFFKEEQLVTMHGPNERISKNQLADSIRFLKNLLNNFEFLD